MIRKKYKQCGIYCYHNMVNGKNYVGQSANLKQRRACFSPNIRYSGQAINRAIKKYGKENFQYSILTHCKPEELNFFEIFYINRLKSNDPKHGYNLTSGGNSRYVLSNETKERIRNSWTNERKKDQSINQTGNKNNNYGHKWNNAQKKHGSIVAIKRSRDRFLKVNGFSVSCLKDKIKEYFFSTKTPRIREIIKMFHISYPTAINTCKEIKLNVSGITSNVYEEILNNVSKSSKKTVVQYNRDNHDIVLNVFESLSEAERITGIHGIKHCVEGNQYSSGGYFWAYSNDAVFTGVYNDEYLCPTEDRLKLTIDVKQKLKDSGLYKRENLYKKVFCYDKNGLLVKTYESVSSTKKDGFSPQLVACCCNNNQIQRTHKGYAFSYKELPVKEVLQLFIKHITKPVLQLTLNGDIINKWESAKKASKTLGLGPRGPQNISRCCHGKAKACGGYKWAFDRS